MGIRGSGIHWRHRASKNRSLGLDPAALVLCFLLTMDSFSPLPAFVTTAKDRTFWVIQDQVAPTLPLMRGGCVCPGHSIKSGALCWSRPGGQGVMGSSYPEGFEGVSLQARSSTNQEPGWGRSGGKREEVPSVHAVGRKAGPHMGKPRP